MYVLINMRWRMVHIWLGREASPSLESGVLVLPELHLKETGTGHISGCWYWGRPSVLACASAIRFSIPPPAIAAVVGIKACYKALRQTCHNLLICAFKRHLGHNKRASQAPVAMVCAKYRAKSGRRLHALLKAGSIVLALMVPHSCTDSRLEKSHGEILTQVPLWTGENGTSKLLNFVRESAPLWGTKAALDKSQPFSARVSFLRPFNQESFGLLPLYDHFSRRFILATTVHATVALVFTTAHKWEIIEPKQYCIEGNIFVFEPKDKFAVFRFTGIEQGHDLITLQAVIPSQQPHWTCLDKGGG
jgi:hypothetical protein